MARRRLVAAVGLVAALTAGAARAQTAPASSDLYDLATLTHGAQEFPRVWRAYGESRLPALDFRNGPTLYRHLSGGMLTLSLGDFLALVIENGLQVRADRYNYLYSQVDLLRAQSGQAVRGVPSAPLPGSLFAGAIGAGVGGNAFLSPAGTGAAAIATSGKLVVFGPRGGFDPTLLLNVSYDNVSSPLNTRIVAGTPTVQVRSAVFQSTFAHELAIGTGYSVSVNFQSQQSSQARLLFNPADSSVVQMQVYQPLLNGSGLALTRRFITVAQNDQDIVKQAFRGSLTTTLSNAADAYWDYVAFRRNVDVAQEVVKTASDQVNVVQQQRALGAAAQLDVVTAQSQLATAQFQLISAQTNLRQQDAVIKNMLSQVDDPIVDAAQLDLTDPLPGPDDIRVPALEQSLSAAVERQWSVKQAELSMTNYQIAQSFTHRSLLPTLSAYAMVNSFALEAGTSPVLRQLARWEYPEYAAGFTFSVPVFNRAAQADDIRARLETQQAADLLMQTKQQVANQLRTANGNLAEIRKEVQAAQLAAQSSRVAFEAEQQRQRVGLSTQYQVSLTQRDLTTAEGAEIQSRVDYAKALVAYQVAAGDFLEQHAIVLDEALRSGMWMEPTKP